MRTNEAGTAPEGLDDQLLELWRRFLKDPSVTEDDDFFERGGDSLLATELLVELEGLIGQTLPPSLLFETGTVNQLTARLRSPATANRKTSFRIGDQRGRLLHFFHGDYSFGGMSVKTIAGVMAPGQPILAIAPHGIGGEPVPATIEQMAADRLPVIRQAQPHGPYLLGGHCNGALVAFETARLLEAAGERVDLVLIIDPVVVSVRKGAKTFMAGLESLQRILGVSGTARQRARVWVWRNLVKLERWSRRQRLKRVGASDKVSPAQVVREIEIKARLAKRREQPAQGERPDPSRRFKRLFLTSQYANALAAYHPEPLDVPVLFFALRYDGVAWKRVSPGMEFVEVPGGHSSFGDDFSPEATERLRVRLLELNAAAPGATPKASQNA